MSPAKFLEVPQKIFPYLDFDITPCYMNFGDRDEPEIAGYTVHITGSVSDKVFKKSRIYSLPQLDYMEEEYLVDDILDHCLDVVKKMIEHT